MSVHYRKSWAHISGLITLLVFVFGFSTPPSISAQSFSERDFPVTFDPGNRRLTTYQEYLQSFRSSVPFHTERLYQTAKPGKGSRERGAQKVLIIVNSSIRSSIQSSLTQYTADLENAGYTVSLWATSGGSPSDVKTHIISESDSLAGVVLIGDIPVPWFEMYYDFYTDNDGDGLVDEDPIDGADNDGDGKTDEDPPYDNDGDGDFNEDHLDGIDNDADGLYDEDTYDGSSSQFPCDLYYMDLDGSWEDYNTDGLLDVHHAGSGDLGPEIYVGRLTASPMTLAGATEVALLNNYFAKNHSYRLGELEAQERALVYVDDDWVPWADQYNSDVQLAYPTTVLVKDKAQTCRDDYRDTRLPGNHEWIQAMLHSSYWEHYFKIYGAWEMEDPWTYATVSSADIQGIDPVALFYNLFACSNCRYVETDYMGGWYIFVDQHGLGAVGATKTGSMLFFDHFYGPLGQEASLGDAYGQWYEYVASYSIGNRQWFWGMTLLGDPTLCPRVPPALTDLEIHVDHSDIVLTWNSSSTKAVARYVIYRNTNPDFEPTGGDSLGWTGGNDFVDVGAAKVVGTNYCYVVKSVDGAGHKSGPSNRVGELDVELINAP